jgi:glycerol uptake facilitator-like aquaporin
MKLKKFNTVVAEFIGTAILLAVITGSGVMADILANGNSAVALLGNSIATGAGLFVLITLLAPISNAHFNPIVTFVSWYFNKTKTKQLINYIIAQTLGAILGVFVVHLMFALPTLQTSTKVRSGFGIWLSELLATLILLSVINIGVKYAKKQVALLVALTVTAGYWFTSSTFFCNPAVTIARSLTNTFVGIQPTNILQFISAQIAATLIFILLIKILSKRKRFAN